MKYKVKLRKLIGISGDPSWPIPQYEYINLEEVQIPVISTGDYLDGRKVIEIRHENDESIVVVQE